jgi:hypothetical protein
MRNVRMVFISEAVEEAFVNAVLHYANTVWRDGKRPRTAVSGPLFPHNTLRLQVAMCSEQQQTFVIPPVRM